MLLKPLRRILYWIAIVISASSTSIPISAQREIDLFNTHKVHTYRVTLLSSQNNLEKRYVSTVAWFTLVGNESQRVR